MAAGLSSGSVPEIEIEFCIVQPIVERSSDRGTFLGVADHGATRYVRRQCPSTLLSSDCAGLDRRVRAGAGQRPGRPRCSAGACVAASTGAGARRSRTMDSGPRRRSNRSENAQHRCRGRGRRLDRIVSDDGERVEHVLERTSAFTRRASFDGMRAVSHTLAANIDVVFLVHALGSPPSPRRLERELGVWRTTRGPSPWSS